MEYGVKEMYTTHGQGCPPWGSTRCTGKENSPFSMAKLSLTSRCVALPAQSSCRSAMTSPRTDAGAGGVTPKHSRAYRATISLRQLSNSCAVSPSGSTAGSFRLMISS